MEYQKILYVVLQTDLKKSFQLSNVKQKVIEHQLVCDY